MERRDEGGRYWRVARVRCEDIDDGIGLLGFGNIGISNSLKFGSVPDEDPDAW